MGKREDVDVPRLRPSGFELLDAACCGCCEDDGAGCGGAVGIGFFSDHSAGSKSISNHSLGTVLPADRYFLFSELHLPTFSNDLMSCVLDS